MLSPDFPDMTVWDRLKSSTLPVVLYGTGDGADKILAVMESQAIPLTAIFVSDDFYRGQSFHGIPVTTYSALEQLYADFIIVVAFGSHLPEILQRVQQMAEFHPLVIPDVPVYGDSLFDLNFIRSYESEYTMTYNLLADETSRMVFREVIQYKLDGRLPHLLASASPKKEVFEQILRLNDQEDYLDLGAYRGDTIQEFLRYTNGVYHSITALEPDPKNYKKLSNFAQPLPNVHLYPCGVSSKKEIIYMHTGRGRGSAIGGNVPVQMVDVDSLNLNISYLKMDVEGWEKAAIQGSAQLLRTHAPKLNIACYHRSEDLFQLPLLIHRIQPAYRIYLRRHPCLPCWDLNLYCCTD